MASNAERSAGRADDSARSADLTDEQLWAELEAEDPTPDDDEEEEGREPDARAADPDDDAPPDRDDDDREEEPGSEPSEDAGDGGEPDGDPAGMDPEELQAQIERLQHALNSEKGRTAASRREIDRLQRQIGAAREAQRDDQDEDRLRQQKEARERAIAESREEYGEVVGPLLDVIQDLEGRVDRLTQREADELEARKAQYRELIAEENRVFEQEHPDGLEVIVKNREAFDDWIEDQPKAIRDIYAANQQEIVDGRSAAYLVGLFKSALLDAGHAPDQQDRLHTRRQRQLDGARSTRSRRPQRASSRPAPDADDPQAHWDYFDRLDRQG